MESTDSSTGTQQQPNLPPGFRFHPTDEELVVHYLKRKAASAPIPVAIIADIDLYKFDPWELPAKAVFGEHEWYFFSPRDRKYPNGARPNRAATSGYWKATGTDKPVLTANGTQKVGVKKALVFYGGKPPKGIKTNWIMHEYRLAENKVTNKPPGYDIVNKKNSLRLDDWVLCRIYKKNNSSRPHDHDKEDSMDDMFGPILPSIHFGHQNASIPQPKATNFPNLFENDHTNMLDGMLSNATNMSQIASTSSKAALPLVSPTANPASTNNLPLRRTLSSLCWDDENAAAPSQNKRFHEDNNAGSSVTRTDDAHHDDNNSSFATLLSQLPQTSVPMQQGMIGSLGDGVLRSPFQMPGMNWYS